ncbi:MAG: hypothetical protein ACON4W_08150 [Parvibaculales bacterium]
MSFNPIDEIVVTGTRDRVFFRRNGSYHPEWGLPFYDFVAAMGNGREIVIYDKGTIGNSGIKNMPPGRHEGWCFKDYQHLCEPDGDTAFITLERDSIYGFTAGKAASLYYWEDGGFKQFAISD